MSTGNSYKVIRFYVNPEHERETIESGISLEEARSICQSTGSSSKTCKSQEDLDLTMNKGGWFLGYTQE